MNVFSKIKKQINLGSKQIIEKNILSRETVLSENEFIADKKPVTDPVVDNKTKVKLSAKSMGLKSVLVNDGIVYMTSFGKGNKAILEKKILNDDIESMQSVPQFDLEDKEHEYTVKGNGWKMPDKYNSDDIKIIPASTDKIELAPRYDAIGRKDQLETRYFGRVFNDNIHIQLIYNIMDIRKIMTVHTTNIIYMLDNMRRLDSGEKDIFGNISFRSSIGEKKYADLFDFPQLAYFGKAFYNIKGNTASVKPEEEIFTVYQILGTVRQACMHEKTELIFDKNNKTDSKDIPLSEEVLFNLKNLWEKKYLDVLDGFYKDATDKMNKDFIKNNKDVNFCILEKMYPEEKLQNFIGEYYDFLIKKTYKSLGFSVKLLREAMLELNNDIVKPLSSTAYDTVRSKLYQFFDFAIVRYFYKNTDAAEKIVKELRRASKDDELKAAVYSRYAVKVFDSIKNRLKIMIGYMNGQKIKNIKSEKGKYDHFVIQSSINDNVSYFTKLIYMLTLFLDGKEINDLVTTLINKFDNIAGFNSVIKDLNLYREYMPDYALFNEADKISTELKVLNGFCRMQKALPNAKKMMYKEALTVLGYNDDNIDDYIDELLCLSEKEATVKKSDINNASAIAAAFGAYLPSNPREYKKVAENLVKGFKKAKVLHEDNNHVTKRMSVKISAKTGFRNFVASNVIESSRFQYLIRYNNPKTVCDLAKNMNIVKFQLSQLPDSQLKRYYQSCSGNISDGKKKDDIVSYLGKVITELNYKDYEKVKQDDRRSTESDKKEKQKMQAVISLYLTMLYLFTKNLVYVNSRYVMAFACCDRDSSLYDITVEKSKEDVHYLDLTKKFIGNIDNEPSRLNKRASDYLKKDIKQTTDLCEKKFRNTVCHLNVIQNAHQYLDDMKGNVSYFACYHYCLQKILLEDNDIADVTEKFNTLGTYHSYNKDFLKALCTPFGYNLPRFKNLSIECLFDKNIGFEKKTDKKEWDSHLPL